MKHFCAQQIYWVRKQFLNLKPAFRLNKRYRQSIQFARQPVTALLSVYIALGIITGILLAHLFEKDALEIIILFSIITLVLFLIILWLIFSAGIIRLRYPLPQLFTFSTAVTAGLLLALNENVTWTYVQSLLPSGIYPAKLLITRMEYHREERCRWQAILEVDSISGVRTKILVSIKDKGMCSLLAPGKLLSGVFAIKSVLPDTSRPWSSTFYWMKRSSGITHYAYLFDRKKVLISEGKSNPEILLEKLRLEILSRVQQVFSADSVIVGLVSAILFGYKKGLPDEIRHEFRTAGIAHLMAVSGLHVGFLYMLVSLLLRGLGSGWLEFFFSHVAVWMFVAVTGFAPSGMRAALMLLLWDFARKINSNTPSINGLALSCVLLLIMNPADLFNPGFQFSFLAVLGIVLFYNLLRHLLIIRPALLWETACLTISAQSFLTGLILTVYGELTPLSVFVNIVAVPLAALFFYVALIAIVTNLSWTSAFAIGLGEALIALSEYVSGIQFAKIDVLPLGWIGFTFWLTGLLVFWYLWQWMGKFRVAGLWLLLCLLSLFVAITVKGKNLAKQKRGELVISSLRGIGVVVGALDSKGRLNLCPLTGNVSLNLVEQRFIKYFFKGLGYDPGFVLDCSHLYRYDISIVGRGTIDSVRAGVEDNKDKLYIFVDEVFVSKKFVSSLDSSVTVICPAFLRWRFCEFLRVQSQVYGFRYVKLLRNSSYVHKLR